MSEPGRSMEISWGAASANEIMHILSSHLLVSSDLLLQRFVGFHRANQLRVGGEPL